MLTRAISIKTNSAIKAIPRILSPALVAHPPTRFSSHKTSKIHKTNPKREEVASPISQSLTWEVMLETHPTPPQAMATYQEATTTTVVVALVARADRTIQEHPEIHPQPITITTITQILMVTLVDLETILPPPVVGMPMVTPAMPIITQAVILIRQVEMLMGILAIPMLITIVVAPIRVEAMGKIR